MGLRPEDFDSEHMCEVWPDNWLAVTIFDAISTQWRVGPGGAYGLDYSVLPLVLRLRGVPRAEWPELFECIRVMESEALATMRKQA